jgi:phage I-like protein
MSEAICSALDVSQGPPEWIHLLPLGEIFAADGRKWRVADPEAIIAASCATRGLPVDYDHQIDNTRKTGGVAPAAGWIKELAVRDGFIAGRVEWTEAGATRVRAREYRFISPVFNLDDVNNVTRILRAALTNDPAIRELAALASNQSGGKAEVLPQLLAALDLPEGADGEAALAKVRDLVAGQVDSGTFVPRQNADVLARELHEIKAKAAQERQTHKINEATRAGKLPPAMRGWAVALCQSDEAAFDNFVALMPRIVGPATLLAGLPPGKDSQPVTADEQAVCRALGITGEQFAKNRGDCRN